MPILENMKVFENILCGLKMMIFHPHFKTSVLRTVWSWKYKFLAVIFSALNFMYAIVFVVPVRNYMLYPAMEEYAWRKVETRAFARLRHSEEPSRPEMMANYSCGVHYMTSVNRNDLNASGIMTYDYLQIPEFKRRVLKLGHGRFLPALNVSQKIEILHLYQAAAAGLGSVGVKHFLVSGTLLGLNRHKGFVPWDDDIDISVGLDSWNLVERSLSCVGGFTLTKYETFHWKFHYYNLTYPFIDIFFYRMDESYVWAASLYIRKSFIYPTRLVFPLGESTFEGVTVPVPKYALEISRRIYEYDVCLVHEGHIQRNMSLLEGYPEGYTVKKIPCKEVSYMYTFFNTEVSQ